MDRLKYPLNHEWHVSINKYSTAMREQDQEWPRFMYAAKDMADEIPRLAMIFKREREGTLGNIHKQCSMSPEQEIVDNHLTCAMGEKCASCPILKSLETTERATPEEIDLIKAWTCAAHILSSNTFYDCGFVSSVGDQMYWDNVHRSLAMTDEQPPVRQNETGIPVSGTNVRGDQKNAS